MHLKAVQLIVLVFFSFFPFTKVFWNEMNEAAKTIPLFQPECIALTPVWHF